MKTKITLLIALAGLCSNVGFAQKARSKPALKPKPVILAVIYDGSGVEPIAAIEDGKLVTVSEEDSNKSKPLSDIYYKPNSKYGLIFGGVPSGTVTIKSSNVGKECGGVSAEASVQSAKAKLSGFLMALATNFKPKSETGYRRKPTSAERAEIEALVRAEYAKRQVSAAALKTLHSYNLTALDVDNDGTAEFVGSYWVAPKADERDQLFFIAEIGDSGKYSFTLTDFAAIGPDDLMSGNVKDLDTMGGELLLDVLDYDSDDVSEIFTIGKGFEGNNYYAYKRVDGSWTKVYETYDYRCGY